MFTMGTDSRESVNVLRSPDSGRYVLALSDEEGRTASIWLTPEERDELTRALLRYNP